MSDCWYCVRTVDTLHLWIPYLPTAYSLKFICNPELILAVLLQSSRHTIYLMPHFFTFLWAFWLVILPFKMVPEKYSADVLSGVSRFKKAVLCLIEKMSVE